MLKERQTVLTCNNRAALAACVTLGILCLPAATFAQSDADTLFLEANRAFRSGAYGEALAGYLAAQRAGKAGPLLHFNMGVAYYRTRDYLAAERELRRAAEHPRIAPLAFYNLGLTNRAQGDKSGARRWFEMAAQRARNPELEELANKALVQLNRTTPRAAYELRRPVDDVGEFSLVAIARVGYDDNVYRSPSEPYVDLAQQGQPLVTPMVQSGTFLPIDLKAEYAFPSAHSSRFAFAYRMNGDFYVDAELDNANEVSHKLSFAAESLLGAKARRPKMFAGEFFARRRENSNFDPDDGLDRDVNGEDISDRFSFLGLGLNTGFEHRLGRFGYGLDARAEVRNYDEVMGVTEYDHKFYLLGAHGFFPILPRTELQVGYKYYAREYGQRLARDFDGDLISTNPTLEYNYRALEGSLRHRLNRAFLVRLDYRRTYRDDQFNFYNDYLQDRVRLRAIFRPTRRFRTNLWFGYRTYDYTNAFAFNDPAGGPKDLEVLEGALVAELKLVKRITLWGEVNYEDWTSTDTRTQFERMRTMLGVKWER